MKDPLAVEEVLDIVAEVLASADEGTGRHRLLEHLVTTAEAVGGGMAACFTLVESDGGRVAVTSPAGVWLQGMHFPWEGSATATLMAGTDPSRLYPVAEAAPLMRTDLAARGVRCALLARASAAGRTVGAVEVFYREDTVELSPDRRRMVEILAAACCTILHSVPDGTEREESPPVGLATVAGSLADGLAVLSGDGKVRAWNHAARELTGVAAGAAMHRSPPFPVPHPGQVIDHRLESGRWIQIVCSPLGSTGERALSFRDVTRSKAAEEARDLFLATTSHELRTPLTVVKGYAETLLERWAHLDDPQRLAALTVIQQRTSQLAELVERLLMGARPKDSAVKVEREPFDVGEMVRSTTAGLLGPNPVHELFLDVPADLPPARGDRPSMVTVVTELVANAVKYSPDGGEIVVSADHDAGTVVLRVADRGIGVQHEDVERVFDRFWQAEKGDQRRFGGVGLGLYIVRRLVDRQDGRVAMRAREAGGTVVEVRLPRADLPPDDSSARVSPR
jgi:two-component system phosphate regulon sensor histidine kinase PhoR